jgi:Calcium-dependent channel, 7TM region, putative phosphate/Cytosolic domain of 10TM putative phosphate transporter
MDSSVYAVLVAFGVDFITFVALFVGFLAYRKVRSPKINLESEIEIRKPYMYEGDNELKDIMETVSSMDLLEINNAIGEWGFVYLTLHQYIIRTLLILIWPGAILVMIYALGDSEANYELYQISITHIFDTSNELLIPLCALVMFSIVLYGLAYYYYIKITYFKFDSSTAPKKNTLMITKIPMYFPPKFLNDRIKSMLMDKFDTGIIEVYSVPLYEKAYEEYLELLEYKQQVKYCEYELRTKNIRPTTFNKNLEKVDAISYFEEKIDKITVSIEKKKQIGLHTNSGRAFVFCDNSAIVREIINFRVDRDEVLKTQLWKFKPALNPNDIIWKNFGRKRKFNSLSKGFYNGLFIVFFLILLTPTSFNNLILDILDSIGAGSLIQGVLGYYLPSLLLLVYQQLILPEAVKFLVEKENHKYKTQEVSSGLNKYLFFLVFYVFLYPLLGLKFVELIGLLFDKTTDWENEFAKNIDKNAQFFTVFLIHQAFLKNGYDLLSTSKYFKAKAKSLIVTTELEKAMAYQADDFQFDFELAVALNILIITCSFLLVYPIILVPALAFFSIRVIET